MTHNLLKNFTNFYRKLDFILILDPKSGLSTQQNKILYCINFQNLHVIFEVYMKIQFVKPLRTIKTKSEHMIIQLFD